ncbi:otoraplin [Halichoerus grypus]|nr:otoraplin [Halichoerus grypus]
MSGSHIKDRNHCSQFPLSVKGRQQNSKKRKMARLLILSLPGLVAICAVHGIFMDRLASRKLCADDECVYTISLSRAQEDYNAPDCRFINVKKGQQIYVYSKLVQENGAGEFWAGSVYGDDREDEMGTLGYFPSSLVEEQQVYQEATKEVPTTDIDFFCE